MEYFNQGRDNITKDGFTYDDIIGFIRQERAARMLARTSVRTIPISIASRQVEAKAMFLDSGLVSEVSELGLEIKRVLGIDTERLI